MVKVSTALTTMDLFVSLQQVLLNKAHITLTAPKRPLTCIIRNMGLNIKIIKSFHYTFQQNNVHLAGSEKLTCVDEDMSAQVVRAAEGSIAVFTYVRLGAGRKRSSLSIQHHRLCKKAKTYSSVSVNIYLFMFLLV